MGRRSSKTVGGTTTAFLYDDVNVVQELSGGTPSANLLTGLGVDEIFTRTDSAGTRHLLTDAPGSTLALTDAGGNILTQYTYEPFGNTIASGQPNANPFQYTGRENDGTGLFFERARYYSPTFQRFTSEDPIGLNGGINLYAYVGNNPVNFSDRFGLKPRPRPPGPQPPTPPIPPGPPGPPGVPPPGPPGPSDPSGGGCGDDPKDRPCEPSYSECLQRAETRLQTCRRRINTFVETCVLGCPLLCAFVKTVPYDLCVARCAIACGVTGAALLAGCYTAYGLDKLHYKIQYGSGCRF